MRQEVEIASQFHIWNLHFSPQDPNARNCHGYRKFVKRTVLENPDSGYLVHDTIIIRYTIELVVSSGGALQKQPSQPVKNNEIQVLAFSESGLSIMQSSLRS